MGFLENLKALASELAVKGGEVAKDAAQKAQDATELAKIKVEIASKEKSIRDLYTKIGKAYYEEYKADAVEFAEDVAEIAAKFAEIDELNSRYEMFKDALNSKSTNVETVVPEKEDVVVDAEVIDLVPAEELEDAVQDIPEEVTEKTE